MHHIIFKNYRYQCLLAFKAENSFNFSLHFLFLGTFSGNLMDSLPCY